MQIFLSLAVAGMWLWICVRNRRLVFCAVLAFLMTGLTSAFQTLPAAEFGRLAVRWVGADEPQGLGETVPYLVHSQYAMKPISLIGIFVRVWSMARLMRLLELPRSRSRFLGRFCGGTSGYVRWLATLALCESCLRWREQCVSWDVLCAGAFG